MQASLLASTAVLGLLLAAPHTAQTVHVADFDLEGPTAISIAISNAVDGDLIVVRNGDYFALNVNGKSLTIVAEAGHAPVVFGTIVVRNLAVDQAVHLIGLEAEPLGTAKKGARFANNEGPVFVEGGRFTGALESLGTEVLNSAAVVFADCEILGGPLGADALAITDSNVHVYGGSILGDTGGGSFASTSKGGHGVRISGGSLFASGATIRGGQGSHGDVVFSSCSPGLDGGDGLRLMDGEPLVWLRDCVVSSGLGGEPAGACGGGVDGVDTNVLSGTVEDVAAPARGFELSPLVRVGETITATFTGAADELCFLIYSASTTPVHLAEFAGTIVPAAPVAVLTYGALPAEGTLTVGATLPGLPLDYLVLQAQGMVYSAEHGFLAAEPRATVLLQD